MSKKPKFEIRLPRRTLDISALAEEAAQPEEAWLLLSPQTIEDIQALPERARLEVRDLLYELGRAMQNTSYPTMRIDLDLEFEPPQDWVASVSLQGTVVREFTHSKAEVAFSFAVREGVIQATSMGLRSRADMITSWCVALGRRCEELDEAAFSLRDAEGIRNAEKKADAAMQDLEINPEGDS